jgi:hypothetical protein
MKRIAILGSLLVVAVSLAVVNPGIASATSSWCFDTSGATPCVLAATRDGLPVDHTDPHWNFQFSDFSAGGEAHWQWNLTYNGSIDVGSAEKTHQWHLTVDMGNVIPRVVFMRGDNVSIVRDQPTLGDYTVEVTANPITLSNSCDQSIWPWTCVEAADVDFHSWAGLLGGEITDFGQWTDPVQREAIYGMDYSTNIDATDIPPSIIGDPSTGYAQLVLDLANAHNRPDGITPFVGFLHLVIPKGFLQTAYGIDDPATLTGIGVVTSLSGTGSGTITAAPDSGSNLDVTGSGISFSARRVHIKRGIITPTRPTNVHAKRVSPTKGKLTFTAAKPRGSRITGYRAVCVNGSTAKVGTAKASPVYVTTLVGGKAYTCKVRAKSKAGFGPWSAQVHLAG